MISVNTPKVRYTMKTEILKQMPESVPGGRRSAQPEQRSRQSPASARSF